MAVALPSSSRDRMTRRPPSIDRAAAVRALADLIRSGLPVRAALAEWHNEIDGPLARSLRDAAARISLGAKARAALHRLPEWGADAEWLGALLEMSLESGTDPAPSLETLADSIEERDRAAARARAAVAGARLSGWMLGGLPLFVLPLGPATRGPALDAPDILILVSGLALCCAGLMWMRKLIPPPPAESEAGLVASGAAALVRGGAMPRDALVAAGRLATGPVGAEMAVAAQRVRLGLPWAIALERSEEPGVRALAAAARAADVHGVPAAAAFERVATELRARDAQAFSTAVGRAPVVMTLPLVLCSLPGFALVAIVPLLRGVGA